ncbi:MAG TPA: hypothetical protein VFW23_09795 [Tepidisphaeraceae bacterium]|nr:hypothetical protein [Tepidisphaeraceae bacterium]
MSENTFKSELLKQNGKSAVDEEVSRLHRTIEAEQRRVRRLVWWTIGVWLIWILMISVALVVPMVQAHSNRPPANVTTVPVVSAPVHAPAHHGGNPLVGMIFGVLTVGAFFGLPVAGVILVLMLILTRRTASMNQVRASLAAIDAQLRQLGAAGLGTSNVPKS